MSNSVAKQDWGEGFGSRVSGLETRSILHFVLRQGHNASSEFSLQAAKNRVLAKA